MNPRWNALSYLHFLFWTIFPVTLQPAATSQLEQENKSLPVFKAIFFVFHSPNPLSLGLRTFSGAIGVPRRKNREAETLSISHR